MKAACIILTVLIVVAIMAVCVMVKFATDIKVEEKRRDNLAGGSVYQLSKTMGVFGLREGSPTAISERFPYVAAITRNSSSTWTFACFASVILVKWVVTSAHCRKFGHTHRVLLYHDYARNLTHTYPIFFWRIHEKFNSTSMSPKYDIAVAKLNVEIYNFLIKPSTFEEGLVQGCEASVWKTVATMDRRLFLTNDFDKFHVKIDNQGRCYESYGVEMDEGLICVDMSKSGDCFVHEFGPIYSGDRVVGILAVKPRDCDMKWAIFTNISYHTPWILMATKSTYYG